MTLPDRGSLTVATSVDVVDLLLEQHRQLRQLGLDIQVAGNDKQRLFAEFTRLVYRHERGERDVVHPVTRDRTLHAGESVADMCSAEEQRAGRAIGELTDVGVHDPTFDTKFAAFHRTLLDHAAFEEREEFPRLRKHVAAQRLYLMANELINVQAMS